MWVCHVSMEDRKEAIDLRRRMIGDSMISGLEEDEIISGIVRDRVGRVMVFSQNKFLSVKISIFIIIIVIIILIVVIIIIVVFLMLSRAVADIGSKILINLVW